MFIYNRSYHKKHNFTGIEYIRHRKDRRRIFERREWLYVLEDPVFGKWLGMG